MSNPGRGDVHVSRPLSNISVAFLQDLSGFIANDVFPSIPVSKQSDLYWTYPKKSWFQSQVTERADCHETPGAGYDLDTAQYFCKVYGVHKDVGDQVRGNADEGINLDREATELVTRQMMLRKELQFAQTHLTTGVWGSDFTPGTLWSAAGSDPIADIRGQKTAVKSVTGFMPNVLVVSQDVHDVLMDHPVILDRIKFTQRGVLSNDLIASLLEVDKYLVSMAVEDTAKQGAPESLGFVNANNGLLAYAPSNPGLLTPSAGYTFSWSGLAGASQGVRVKKFRLEERACERIEAEMCWDHHIVAPELGVYLNAPV